MKRLRIKVEQEHIDKGVADSCYRCPVALAVPRPSQGAVARVTSLHVTLYMIGKTVTYKTSRRLEQYITDIDDGEPVPPATFVLTEQAQVTPI